MPTRKGPGLALERGAPRRTPPPAAARDTSRATPWPIAAVRSRADGPAGGVRPVPPQGVLALQRLAGNKAVDRLLPGTPNRRPASPVVTVQLDDPPAPAPEGERTPVQLVDGATFAGFTTWAQAATADADSALPGAIGLAEALGSPYQHRLNMLIDEVIGAANTLDWGLSALREGRTAPALTADPLGFVDRFEHHLQVLHDVTDAWQAVTTSAVMTLIGMIAEAQVERAQALQRELDDLVGELRTLQRIADGDDLRGAVAQLGINAVISGVLLAVTFANPIVGVAVAVGSVAVQATLDELLGPSGNDAGDVAAAGVGIAGSAAEARAASRGLAEASSKLRVAARRLGALGAAMGTTLDVLETREAVTAHESARARIRVVTARLNRVARQLEPLRPLLAYPDLAAGRVARIQSHATTLRQNAQIVLQGRGQL